MKPHERRQAGAYPYYKLAVWDERNQCWKDGKHSHPTIDAAKAEAERPGRYRLSEVSESGRRDLEPFSIA